MLQEDIELLTDFKNESLEHINETEPLFLRIEQTEGEAQKEIVNAIFRAVHRVKGAAGFFDLGIIQNLAHASENLLMKVRDGELAISRGLDDHIRDKYFEESGRAWSIQPNIKGMVALHQFNLMEPFTRWGSFDLILCRNVLIYFSINLKRDILDRFSQSLVNEGALVVGGSQPRFWSAWDWVDRTIWSIARF